jgi:DNA (cytosine-5)-methyltransferase 1
VDLFSGAGGLTEGLKQAGFEVRFAVDNDELACDTYSLNHPDVDLHRGSIRSLDPKQLLKRLGLDPGELDVLAACPPCQGFSTIRTRNGSVAADDRNELLFEVIRFARVIRPKSVMLENVPGLARDRRFVTFRKRLAGLGYKSRWQLVDAADFGVPQRRIRLILMATLTGRPRLAPRARTRRDVRSAIGHLGEAGSSGDRIHDLPQRRSEVVRRRISAIPIDGGSRSSLPPDLELACHIRTNGFRDVYGRMSWADVAPTLTTGCYNPSKGRFLHPVANRAISMREASLLQTFPPGYRFPDDIGHTALARLIGNALPPEFIRRHARSLRRALSQ